MKKLLILIILLSLPLVSFAKDVTLSWDASPSEGVTGYKVHYSVNTDQPFPVILDVGNVLTAQVVDLPDDTGYYFSVSAYDAAGFESVYSNIVYSPGFAPPVAPAGLSGVTRVNNIDIPIN